MEIPIPKPPYIPEITHNLRPNQGSQATPTKNNENFPELPTPETMVKLTGKGRKMERMGREKNSRKGGKRSTTSSPSVRKSKVSNNTDAAADRDRSPGNPGEHDMQQE